MLRNIKTLAIAVWRITLVLLHILLGLSLAGFCFPICTKALRQRLIVGWSQRLLNILNLTLSVSGNLAIQPGLGLMLVANHISWLDIHLIHALYPARFVAKSEIQRWPIFGFLAQQAGTLFIRRSSNVHAASMMQTVATCLAQGEILCCFPEGTTSDGLSLLPFKGSLLQAAIAANVPCQPVALRYFNQAQQVDTDLAFIGDTTLLQSIWRIANIAQPRAQLMLLPPIAPAGHDRRGLTIALQHAIAQQLHTHK